VISPLENYWCRGDVTTSQTTSASSSVVRPFFLNLLEVGRKCKFRLINISTNNQGMQVSLREIKGPVEWRVIAKDGADLPSNAVRSSKAELTIALALRIKLSDSPNLQGDFPKRRRGCTGVLASGSAMRLNTQRRVHGSDGFYRAGRRRAGRRKRRSWTATFSTWRNLHLKPEDRIL
jgi:hypothetical protein